MAYLSIGVGGGRKEQHKPFTVDRSSYRNLNANLGACRIRFCRAKVTAMWLLRRILSRSRTMARGLHREIR